MTTADDDPIAEMLARYRAQKADPSLVPTWPDFDVDAAAEPESEPEPEPEPAPKPVLAPSPVPARVDDDDLDERVSVLLRIRSGIALIFLSGFLGAAVAAVAMGIILLILLVVRTIY